MDFGAPHIPGSQIGPSTEPLVLMLHTGKSMGLRSLCGMTAMSGLNAGFLVGANDTVVRVQRLAFPETFVEVQNSPCLQFKSGVAGENPSSVAPGLDGILGEPAPDRSVANGSDESAAQDFLLDLRDRVARQRQVLVARKLTGQSLDGDHHTGGKSGLAARCEVVRTAPLDVARRSACATC